LVKVKEKKEGSGKLAIRWKDGVYLGIRAASGEVIVVPRKAFSVPEQ